METQDICVHFWAFYVCDVILIPDYQLISRQISNQLARGYKSIGRLLQWNTIFHSESLEINKIMDQ